MIKIPLKGISNKDIDEQIPKSATFTALPLFWAFERLVILTEPIKCSFSYFDYFLAIFTILYRIRSRAMINSAKLIVFRCKVLKK